MIQDNTKSEGATGTTTVAVTKAGAGSWVLSGANSYTGGTNLNGGTLSVGQDGNLGGSAGALSFDGGKLLLTGGFSSNRNATLNAGGGTIDTNNNAYSLDATSGSSAARAR